NQFFTLIPNQLAETVRNFDIPPVAIYHRDILRLHFKLWGLQFLAKCFKGRSGVGLSFWHVDTSVYALRYKRCAFVAHCEESLVGRPSRTDFISCGVVFYICPSGGTLASNCNVPTMICSRRSNTRI